MVPKLSQSELAKALGVTFQQVQKYEKGRNRMSAAMMVRIAEVLNVDIQSFFSKNSQPVQRIPRRSRRLFSTRCVLPPMVLAWSMHSLN